LPTLSQSSQRDLQFFGRETKRMKTKMANEPMDRIPMPAALLAFRLRSRLGCQKQVGIGHRGRSQEILSLLITHF
jgi:hypothetical protein